MYIHNIYIYMHTYACLVLPECNSVHVGGRVHLRRREHASSSMEGLGLGKHTLRPKGSKDPNIGVLGSKYRSDYCTLII